MKPVLRLDRVCKRFGGVVAADNVSFAVLPGEIHGLIGPNGAGKTTLMNLISGIYAVDSGSIYLEDKEVTTTPSHTRGAPGYRPDVPTTPASCRGLPFATTSCSALI